ncbi:MAG TPA: XRE family transcriptional regulator [Ruminococcaceae bacterium]|jgi:transcriptional regulator with XRE-family HTH domain|nr:XRE family transcriptional regulator [Oscillospiraceae bacterium]
MSIDMKKVGLRLKELRESVNLTQKDIASYLSVDQSLVSKFETGERSISSDMLKSLSNLYCCPIPSIISGEKISAPYSFAFRTKNLNREDLSALAAINKIALNQMQMDQLIGGGVHDR